MFGIHKAAEPPPPGLSQISSHSVICLKVYFGLMCLCSLPAACIPSFHPLCLIWPQVMTG